MMNRTEEVVFKYSKGFKWFCFFGIILFWGMLAASIVLALKEDILIPKWF